MSQGSKISRLDRLVLLLENGSNALIRNTAAQQLADLQKDHPDELYNFLSRVVPFLIKNKWETRHAAAKAIAGIVDNHAKFDPNEDEAEDDSDNVKAEDDQLPIKSEHDVKFEGKTNGHQASGSADRLELRTLDLATIVAKGQKLLGSGARELNPDMVPLDPNQRLAQQKKSLMSRLGLADEYIEEDGYFKEDAVASPSRNNSMSGLPRVDTTQSTLSRNSSTVMQSPIAETPGGLQRQGSVDEVGLSRRQLNMLKRKRKQEAATASKVRVFDIGGKPLPVASTAAPPESPAPAIKGEESDVKSDILSLERTGPDDDTKMVTEFKGEVIPDKPDIQSSAEEDGLEWPFEKLCDILAVNLFDSSWEVRHGAALGLKEIVRSHGAGAGRRRGKTRKENNELNRAWLDDMACRYCCVMMLDRFGDYVSDNVVAPIRETVGQALAALMQHLSSRTTEDLYALLYRMVMQRDIDLTAKDNIRIWEVTHGGMLGLKYLAVLRKDVRSKHLDEIVEAANLGLIDSDDDVRAASAATLIPIAEDLVRLRPEKLRDLMNTVWDCLDDIKDDLSASTGSVMDLLAKLSNYEEVLQAMRDNAEAEKLEDGIAEHSFEKLVPRLYPFLRHTISSVRSAVLRALLTFLRIEDPSTKSWVDAKTLRLVFQNVLIERNEEPLDLSMELWTALVDFLSEQRRFKREFDIHAEQLLKLAMHPIGVPRAPVPMDYTLIMKPSGQFLAEPAVPQRKSEPPNGEEPKKRGKRKTEKKEEPPSKTHNVDGPMLQGDIDLVTYDVLVRSRIYAAKAFGRALVAENKEGLNPDLYRDIESALSSTYSTSQMSAAFIIEEQVRLAGPSSELPVSLSGKLQKIVEEERPNSYTDLVLYLQIARSQCQSLLNAFKDFGKIPPAKIPTIAVIVQGHLDAGPIAFGLDEAEKVVGEHYEKMFKSMSVVQRMTAKKPLDEAKGACLDAIKDFSELKAERDVRVRAAASAALVGLKLIPKRVAKLIRGLMDSIKNEEIFRLQKRSAASVASLLQHYSTAASRGPADKIVANLAKFYCIDTSDTPEYIPNAGLRDAILSLRKEEDRKDHQEAVAYEKEAREARITRRGAKEALDQVVALFGKDVFKHAPVLKQMIEEPLTQVLGSEKTDSDDLGEIESELGQKIVDAFSVMRVLAPSLHEELHDFLDAMIPHMLTALKCNYAVFRYAAAKCFATICSHLNVKGMTVLVEKVLPTINNPVSVHYRQGAIEACYHLIHIMENRILPYVVFLIVPILGRMSDPNQEVRLIATTAFATLVKLVPLEEGIPDPPGFSEELLKGREKERKFVAQMLDPKKTEPFEIPVAIKAKLRSYQQDGVNWLHFLNRFNLHGVLCDDMGLGKTLQTLCIVASDHHLRAQAYEETKDLAMRKLPSLIVCPPTLSGHWMQEIKQYAPFLTAVAYVGPPAERAKARKQLATADIVITSYDVCRNDISVFSPVDWNYCVLDEGHLIKNPKAKTSMAVKTLKSNHRLILSGTPIQNNVLELWSLFDFLMPGFLGTEKVFHDRFAKPIAASRNAKSSSKEQEKGALAIEALHKQVLPFLLRRLKEEVLDDLPPKIIQNYYCDLSDLQKRLFDDFAKKEKKAIQASAGGDSKEGKQHIFQALQYMRKLCNTPSLVVKPGHGQYESIQQHLRAKKSSLNDIAHAPKLSALRDLLTDCGIGAPPPPDGEIGTQENYVAPHRALVFCQMKEMLDIVQKEVLAKLLPSVQYLRLDGGVPSEARQGIVNKFNSDPSYDVLLLTTSVGGLGLNLTGADTVIFVEHDWNPQKDMQAMDRAHRIGQKRVVNVYRLITRGTLEEKILNLQRFKMDVASTVVNQQNAGLGTMGTDQLLDLFELDNGDSGVRAEAVDKGGEIEIDRNEEDAVDATGEIIEKGKSGVLDGLQELWDDTQYKEEYNLDEFLKTMNTAEPE